MSEVIDGERTQQAIPAVELDESAAARLWLANVRIMHRYCDSENHVAYKIAQAQKDVIEANHPKLIAELRSDLTEDWLLNE
jgi:hypothetical protein